MLEFVEKYKLYLGLAILTLFIVGLITLSVSGRKSKGVQQAQIPPETIEFIKQIISKIHDIRIDISDTTSSESDDLTYKIALKYGLKYKVSGENFIVYYKEASFEQQSKQILKFAEDSKQIMLKFFDSFPNTNKRKIPVYFFPTYSEYQKYFNKSSIAHTSISIYSNNVLFNIFCSTKIFEHNPQKIITHEVAHCAHFNMINYRNFQNLTIWFIEGLASFVAGETERLTYLKELITNKKIIPLTELSKWDKDKAYHPFYADIIYSEGFSVFYFMEKFYGFNSTKKFIHLVSRETNINNAMIKSINKTIDEFNSIWLQNLKTLALQIKKEFTLCAGLLY